MLPRESRHLLYHP